jgi:hypothetical protein
VLSLSIVPAQKAADVFSSAILKLYARDRTTLWVFTLLHAQRWRRCCAAPVGHSLLALDTPLPGSLFC